MHEHMHKGRAYREALERRGYVFTERITGNKCSAVFLDHDISVAGTGRRKQVYMAYEQDIPLFLYPHSARPNIMYDIWRPWPFTKASFVIAEGHAEVLRRIGYETPIEITGWTYTDIRPFNPGRKHAKLKVLFAPMHPLGSGYLIEIDRELNFQIFKMLINMPEIDLTVRYLGTLEENKLWHCPRAKYINGKPDGTTAEILQADIVISAYTHAYMAIALGKPLLMMGERTRPHAGNHLWTGWGEQWEKYKEYMEFPFNICDTEFDPDKCLTMMTKAMQKNKKVEDWKKLFIGKPFDTDNFVDRVEAYL